VLLGAILLATRAPAGFPAGGGFMNDKTWIFSGGDSSDSSGHRLVTSQGFSRGDFEFWTSIIFQKGECQSIQQIVKS
jgi:hypothetical protein